jgi:hypothetical protein
MLKTCVKQILQVVNRLVVEIVLRMQAQEVAVVML